MYKYLGLVKEGKEVKLEVYGNNKSVVAKKLREEKRPNQTIEIKTRE